MINRGRDVSTLAQLLSDAAEAHPDAPAIIDLERTWSFSDADRKAGQLATALHSLGMNKGDRVGVHLGKCGEGFVAMHGVVRAGGVAVPLDPGSPVERLARICEFMEISTVITHDPCASKVSELCSHGSIEAVIGLSEPLSSVKVTVQPESLSSFESMAPVELDATDRAYVITTSGSTGEPKGIAHTHRSGLAYAVHSGAAFDVNPADRIADIAPHHFDISTFALWTAPLHCASIVVVPEPYQRLPASHSALLAETGVTIWYSVPFLLQQLVTRGELKKRDLSALRMVQIGGEVIASSVIAEFMRSVPSASLANIYGPAEVNHCSMHVLEAPPANDLIVPIGRPWAAAHFRIADPDADIPPAVSISSGELWVESATMMDSYFGLTQEESNIVEVDGARWYRTGDLVSADSDGLVTFRGRSDHQVKVRGHRVELEGIEVALEDLGLVNLVVATVLRDSDGGDRVVAGVIDPASDFDEEAFLAAGRERLPAYAAPTTVVTLNGTIVTGSGKLDRRVLRRLVIDTIAEQGRS